MLVWGEDSGFAGRDLLGLVTVFWIYLKPGKGWGGGGGGGAEGGLHSVLTDGGWCS